MTEGESFALITHRVNELEERISRTESRHRDIDSTLRGDGSRENLGILQMLSSIQTDIATTKKILWGLFAAVGTTLATALPPLIQRIFQ